MKQTIRLAILIHILFLISCVFALRASHNELYSSIELSSDASLSAKAEGVNKRTVDQKSVQHSFQNSSVTVTESIADIYSTIEGAPLLTARCKEGDTFEVIDSIGEFYKIRAWGRVGYIHSKDVVSSTLFLNRTRNKNDTSVSNTKVIRIASTVSLSLIIIIVLIVAIRSRVLRNRRLHYRSALLLSEIPEELTMTTEKGKKISFRRYLLGLDTTLVNVESTIMLRKHMARHMPDIILVDWRISSKVADLLRKNLTNYRLSAATTLIFYHAKDTSDELDSEGFGDALVHVFEHEPEQERMALILSGESSIKSKRSDENPSYLSGVIHGDAFQDVLQLIEQGGKTGCLVIEDEDPFGVIFFKNGVIVYAATRIGMTGLNSIYQMFELRDGSFFFQLDRTPPREDLALSAVAVLMEWSAQVDYIEMTTQQMQAISESPV